MGEELYNLAMDRQTVDSFAYGMLSDLGFEDWGVDWSKASPGLCIHELKKILLPIKFLDTQPLWFAFEYVIHEIAHIRTYSGTGSGHTANFFAEYARLVDKYLGQGEEGEIEKL